MQLLRSARAPGRQGRYRLIACGLLLFAAAFPPHSPAAATVEASYRQAEGTTLTIEISIASPPPSSLILVQQLPAGIRVTNASPPASNVDTAAGNAKWLLRDVSPGTRTIRMSLDRAVEKSEISAEIRYMSAGGGMQNLQVKKP
jgi:hypothetical protein